MLAALLLIAAVFGTVGVLGYTLSGPAAGWISKAPQNFAQLEQRIHVLKRPVEEVQKATQQVEKITENKEEGGAGAAPAVTSRGPASATR